MADILVRNLDPKTVTALKRRAAAHRRSLAQEVRSILEEASAGAVPTADPAIVARRIRDSLRRRRVAFSDSGTVQAEDRTR